MTREHLLRRKQKLYDYMYRFTANECTACSKSGCACKDTICAHVEQVNEKRGVRFAHTGHVLRFIGAKGCVVPPHLRETCTIYICDPARKDAAFRSETYERLKKLIGRVEWCLMEHEERHPENTPRKTAVQNV